MGCPEAYRSRSARSSCNSPSNILCLEILDVAGPGDPPFLLLALGTRLAVPESIVGSAAGAPIFIRPWGSGPGRPRCCLLSFCVVLITLERGAPLVGIAGGLDTISDPRALGNPCAVGSGPG